jgi:hypothetical protein
LVLEVKLRASHILDKRSTTELDPQVLPQSVFETEDSVQKKCI